MSTATLNIKIAPRRMLTAKEAAGYCGLSEKGFAHFCNVPPVQLPGPELRYDMHDLDAWLDSLKTGVPYADDDIVGRLGT
jgi:hypothetical protein